MLIGLNGSKGSGKDTVGQYLVEDYGFTRISFADKLKKSAAELFNIPVEKWDEWKNDDRAIVSIKAEWWDSADRSPDPALVAGFKTSMSVRYFLQRYGTESHRNVFGDDFWVDALFRDYDPTDGGNYVVTDARFPNELRRIKELNGYNLNINRRRDVSEDSHISEAPPPAIYIDSWIDNNSTFNRLYRQIDNFMATFPSYDGPLSKTAA
jgi:hypothetical protein